MRYAYKIRVFDQIVFRTYKFSDYINTLDILRKSSWGLNISSDPSVIEHT